MKTVGEILKKARLKKGIKKKEIAKKTKISINYVKALENNDYSKLPEAAFVKGFIQNYAKAVGLNPQQALAVFRRDYDQTVKGRVVPRELTRSEVKRNTIWNPKTTVVVVILSISVTLAGYFLYQHRLLSNAPPLEIISPKEQEKVTATVTITGKSDSQATVTINNQQIEVEENGEFSQSVVLPQGTRVITIEATNRSGKSRTIQRTVYVEL